MHCKRLALVTVLALATAALPLTAAGSPQKKKKGGGASHSMTGCLAKGDEARTFKLTNVEGSGPKTVEIIGAAKGVDLSPHVGHKVTITGTEVSARKAAKAEKTKNAKEEAGEHHMRVTAVTMVSATCQ
jgi:hypothetical protein